MARPQSTCDGEGMTADDVPGRHASSNGRAVLISLAVPITGRRRAQRALARAERHLVARMVTDRGIGPWRARCQRRLEAARRTFSRRGRLSRGLAAAVVVALSDKATRDRCWREVEADRDPAWPAFWLHLSRHALPPYRAEPLFLLAWTAWRQGDVVLARAAAEATVAEDAGHRGAAMLRALLRLQLESRRLPSLACEHATGSRAR